LDAPDRQGLDAAGSRSSGAQAARRQAGQLTRGELEQNCAELARLLNERVPLDVGFVR
jgi:hypothetical protein